MGGNLPDVQLPIPGGPCAPKSLVPLQCHQGLVQPLPQETAVWEPPQHGELWQQGAEVGGAGAGRSLHGAGGLPRGRELHPCSAPSGSTRTGRALSVTCVPSWRGSTSLTRWRSGWRRTSTPTWTSCGIWCGTTGPSSASRAGPRPRRGCSPGSRCPLALGPPSCVCVFAGDSAAAVCTVQSPCTAPPQ